MCGCGTSYDDGDDYDNLLEKKLYTSGNAEHDENWASLKILIPLCMDVVNIILCCFYAF